MLLLRLIAAMPTYGLTKPFACRLPKYMDTYTDSCKHHRHTAEVYIYVEEDTFNMYMERYTVAEHSGQIMEGPDAEIYLHFTEKETQNYQKPSVSLQIVSRCKSSVSF